MPDRDRVLAYLDQLIATAKAMKEEMSRDVNNGDNGTSNVADFGEYVKRRAKRQALGATVGLLGTVAWTLSRSRDQIVMAAGLLAVVGAVTVAVILSQPPGHNALPDPAPSRPQQTQAAEPPVTTTTLPTGVRPTSRGSVLPTTRPPSVFDETAAAGPPAVVWPTAPTATDDSGRAPGEPDDDTPGGGPGNGGDPSDGDDTTPPPTTPPGGDGRDDETPPAPPPGRVCLIEIELPELLELCLLPREVRSDGQTPA
ncbi:hypothetical protein BAY59_10980 [Prauserella coralliicola]|nr:hypothetical protein BAY59_10980 [Prauserella coralliicola]